MAETNSGKPEVQSEDVYIPGTCNIGKEEISARRKSAVVSIIFTIVCIVVIQVFTVSHLWRLLIFIPAASVGIGVQQVYMKFCLNFGFRGVYNFGKLGTVHSAEVEEFMKKDRAKATRMVVSGLLFGAAVAVIYFFLPF